jgi:hypothetical protein
METKICVKIDNMIRNYCYNFLSYLYATSGWKRVMFDMAKEKILGRNRIVITETGNITITCYSFLELIECMTFIQSEFENSRMGYYLFFDENTIVKHDYIEPIVEKEIKFTKLSLNESINEISKENIEEEYKKEEKEINKIYTKEELDELEDRRSSERYLYGVLFLLSLTKLCEYF